MYRPQVFILPVDKQSVLLYRERSSTSLITTLHSRTISQIYNLFLINFLGYQSLKYTHTNDVSLIHSFSATNIILHQMLNNTNCKSVSITQESCFMGQGWWLIWANKHLKNWKLHTKNDHVTAQKIALIDTDIRALVLFF